jgi:hypothetical protein
MLDALSVQMRDGVATLDDGTTVHTFADPGALRLFVRTWRAIRKRYPTVAFVLNDDATVLEWHQPGPRPDFVQIVADDDAAAAQEAQAEAALRTRVRALAQSAVGVQIDQLSAPQVRALIAILLYKQGAIDKNGATRPLVDWEQP